MFACVCVRISLNTKMYCEMQNVFYTWFMLAAEIQVFCRSDDLQDLASNSTYLEKYSVGKSLFRKREGS